MNDPTLAELQARRDQLKITVDAQGGASLEHAAGEPARAELRQTIGRIAEILHAPYEAEVARLRERRSQLAAELTGLNHKRQALRSAHETAQGARTAALGRGDDGSDHLASSKRLAVELADCETAIAELEHRVRGVDGQLTALREAEGHAILSGVSAS